MENNGLSWNANQPFYDHMKSQIWDKMTDADARMNEHQGEMKLNALENLYSAVIHWLDMIRFYINPEELEKLENIIKEIENITKGVEFSSAGLSASDNYKIKSMISSFRAQLWFLTAKNGMLPTKRDMTGDDVWF